MRSLIMMFFLFMTITSCAELDFFARRSFADQMEERDDPMFMPGEDFPVMMGDSGKQFRSREEITKRTPPSRFRQANTAEKNSLEQEYRKQIGAMSEGERKHFERDENQFSSLSEKLYYLQLGRNEQKSYKRFRSPASAQKLYLGMNKDAVLSRWGTPIKVEIAGHPRQQNERWTYYRDGKLQQVIFEGGTLQGWSL